ncbi:MAG: hypothetical protein ABIG93_03010 [archaeon]
MENTVEYKTYNTNWCKKVLQNIESLKLSKRNNELLNDFKNYLFTNPGEARVAKVKRNFPKDFKIPKLLKIIQ